MTIRQKPILQSIILLIVLITLFLVLIIVFNDVADLDEAKFLEESSKILASFVITVTAFWLSAANSRSQLANRAQDLENLLLLILRDIRPSLEDIVHEDLKIFERATANNLREMNERRKIFLKAFRTCVTKGDSILEVLTEPADVLARPKLVSTMLQLRISQPPEGALSVDWARKVQKTAKELLDESYSQGEKDE